MISPGRMVRAWRRMPASERRATIAVVTLVPLVSTSLWLLGFRRTVSWVERTARVGISSPRPSPRLRPASKPPAFAKATAGKQAPGLRQGYGQQASPVIKEGVAAIGRVRRYTPWSGRCLARALSLWWVLRRRGVTASLHLGVRKSDGKLDAHAWVTHDGRVLADSDSVWTDFPGQFSATGELAFSREPAPRSRFPAPGQNRRR